MPDQGTQPQDKLGRLILRGMKGRGLSYQDLADAIGTSKSWPYQLVHGKVKLVHGNAAPNRARLQRITEMLGLDRGEVEAAVADRHLVRTPADADGEYDWVRAEDGDVTTLVTKYSRLSAEQKAAVLRLVEEYQPQPQPRPSGDAGT